jgi:hypothetical protein
VTTSSDKTIKEIKEAFDALSIALQHTIEQRKQTLISEVLKVKEEGILSLKPYRDILQSKLDSKEESSPRDKSQKKISFAERFVYFTLRLSYNLKAHLDEA